MYWAFSGDDPANNNLEAQVKENGDLDEEIKTLIVGCVKKMMKKRKTLIEIADELNDLFNLHQNIDELSNYKKKDAQKAVRFGDLEKLLDLYIERNDIRQMLEIVENIKNDFQSQFRRKKRRDDINDCINTIRDCYFNHTTIPDVCMTELKIILDDVRTII